MPFLNAIAAATPPSTESAKRVDPKEDAAFQELFVRTMLAEVQRSMPEGSLLGGELEMFGDILLDELATTLSKTGAFHVGGRRSDGVAPVAPPPIRSAPRVTRSAELRSAILPVDGRNSSRYGARVDPIHGHERHHDGMDIAAPIGTPIRAALGGTVISSGQRGGYGNAVLVEHDDGSQALYAHCSRLDVSPGQRIRPGQPIAAVGSTGRSTGPHLHFELRINGEAVDPQQHLAFRIP